MHAFINILLSLHFIGLAMGMGGGIALSQIGPKLIAAPAHQREQLWPLEKFFSRVGSMGVVVLLATGPLMVWLRFGGLGGLSWWFWAKMILVTVAVGGVGLHDWAGGRFQRGDERAVPLMFIGGRLAGITMLLAMFCAVFAFN